MYIHVNYRISLHANINRAVLHSEKSGNRRTATVPAALIGTLAPAAVEGLFVAAGAGKLTAVNGMLVGVDERATTVEVGADNGVVDDGGRDGGGRVGAEVAGGTNGDAGSEALYTGGAGRSGQTSGQCVPSSIGPIMPASNGETVDIMSTCTASSFS